MFKSFPKQHNSHLKTLTQNKTIATSKPSLTPAYLVISFSPPLHNKTFGKKVWCTLPTRIHSPPTYSSPTALNLLCKVTGALPNSGHLVPAASTQLTLTFFQKCVSPWLQQSWFLPNCSTVFMVGPSSLTHFFDVSIFQNSALEFWPFILCTHTLSADFSPELLTYTHTAVY